ncbi:NACHT domain-containing protein [Streptomyces griseocarneus]|uniref:NACHT domain-containing protein n=1 Tax=Streptomyces griseocarneus TaxID=51201 RepID=UPI00167F0E3E|nr:NACHT domain-containing protein [Streptomyces griseocarneus]MBZ6473902.1 NACHT domain-containing protein [Streptomyces griseocarneus]GHG65815.1 hypothetical protein GCM10018779_36760 [Streptomyces griseocarneus]
MSRALIQPTRRRVVRNALLAGLALVFLAASAWIFLRHHSGERFIGVSGLFTGIAALAMSVADYFRPREEPSDPGTLADHLATTVEGQWSEEAGARSLRDPGVLPLSWAASARAVADSPAAQVSRSPEAGQIVRLRLDGRLDGRFTDAVAQLADSYGRVDSGRLVVLGEPGAGKTVLAILLTLGLLKARTPGSPVPVLLAVSTWDPICEPLDDWIVHTLASSYYSGRRDIPRRLLERGLLLPILDGLDEIPESERRSAIRAINRTLGGDRPIVVTCRSAEYEDVIQGGAPVLRRAPVVEVEPVAVDDVVAYLRDVEWPDGTDWTAVFAHLRASGRADDPLSSALSTPLMVSLTRLVYEKGGGDPGELLDSDRFDCRHAVEDYLLGRLIDAAYEPERLPSGRVVEESEPEWDAAKARRWLTYLAHYLHRHRERDLAWWLMSQRLLSPWVAPGIGIGVGAVLMVAVLAWASVAGGNSQGGSLVFGSMTGSAFAVVAMVIWYATAGRRPGRLSLSVRGSLGRLRRGFATGLALVAVPAVPFLAGSFIFTSLGRHWSMGDINIFAMLVACSVTLATVIGLAMAVHNWLQAPPSRPTQADPLTFLQKDRRSSLAGALAAGGVVGALSLLAVVLGMTLGRFGVQSVTHLAEWSGRPALPELWSAGYRMVNEQLVDSVVARVGEAVILPGVIVALLILLSRAWPRFLITRALLALKGELPWRLLTFLSDARDRGLLRQSGGTYQFRHIRLQEQLVDNASRTPAGLPGPRVVPETTTRRRVLAGASATLAVGVLGGAAAALPRDRSLAILTSDRFPFPENQFGVAAMAFSHDGRTLSVCNQVGSTSLLTWGDPRRTADIHMHQMFDIREITFSADDRIVAVNYNTSDGSSYIDLWEAATSRPFNPPGFAGNSGAASNDGRFVAVTRTSGSIDLWDTAARRWSASLSVANTLPDSPRPTTISLSHDGLYLAAATDDGKVILWDRRTETVVGGPKIPGTITELKVSTVGTVVAVATDKQGDKRCHLWHWQAGPIAVLPAYNNWLVSGDGSVLATSRDKYDDRYKVELWETATGRALPSPPAPYDICALNRNGSLLATADQDGAIHLWDTRGGGRDAADPFLGHTAPIVAAAFADKAGFLATACDDNVIRIWRVPHP